MSIEDVGTIGRSPADAYFYPETTERKVVDELISQVSQEAKGLEKAASKLEELADRLEALSETSGQCILARKMHIEEKTGQVFQRVATDGTSDSEVRDYMNKHIQSEIRIHDLYEAGGRTIREEVEWEAQQIACDLHKELHEVVAEIKQELELVTNVIVKKELQGHIDVMIAGLDQNMGPEAVAKEITEAINGQIEGAWNSEKDRGVAHTPHSRMHRQISKAISTFGAWFLQAFMGLIATRAVSAAKLPEKMDLNSLSVWAEQNVIFHEDAVAEKLRETKLSQHLVRADKEVLSNQNIRDTLFEACAKRLKRAGMGDSVPALRHAWNIEYAENLLKKAAKLEDDPETLSQAIDLYNDAANRLMAIPPHEMPLDILADIDITETNRELLTAVWSHQLTELYVGGELHALTVVSTPSDLDATLAAAERYLSVRQEVPEELLDAAMINARVEVRASEADIRAFLMAHLPSLSGTERSSWEAVTAMQFYQSEIAFVMDEYIAALLTPAQDLNDIQDILYNPNSSTVNELVTILSDRIAQFVVDGKIDKKTVVNFSNTKLRQDFLLRFQRHARQKLQIDQASWLYLEGVRTADRLAPRERLEIGRLYVPKREWVIKNAPQRLLKRELAREKKRLNARLKRNRGLYADVQAKAGAKIKKAKEGITLLETVLADWDNRAAIAGDNTVIVRGGDVDIAELTTVEMEEWVQFYGMDENPYGEEEFIKDYTNFRDLQSEELATADLGTVLNAIPLGNDELTAHIEITRTRRVKLQGLRGELDTPNLSKEDRAAIWRDIAKTSHRLEKSGIVFKHECGEILCNLRTRYLLGRLRELHEKRDIRVRTEKGLIRVRVNGKYLKPYRLSPKQIADQDPDSRERVLAARESPALPPGESLLELLSEEVVDTLIPCDTSPNEISVGPNLNVFRLETFECTGDTKGYLVDMWIHVTDTLMKDGRLEELATGRLGASETEIALRYLEIYLECLDAMGRIDGVSKTMKSDLDAQLTTLEKSVPRKLLEAMRSTRPTSGESSKPLSQMEIDGLRILGQHIDGLKKNGVIRRLSTKEKTVLLRLLHHASGNLEFNARVKEIKWNPPFGLSRMALDFVFTFSFKTQNLDQLQELTGQLKRSVLAAISGEAPAPMDRLSLKEMGQLYTFTRYHYLFQQILDLGLDDVSSVIGQKMAKEMMEAAKSIAKASDLFDTIGGAVEEEKPYEGGDILLTRKEQELAYGEKTPCREDRLQMALITPFGHAAKIYRTSEGETHLSHVTGYYYDVLITVSEMIYSDVFRIDVAKLVVKGNHRVMQEVFGDDWRTVVQKMYVDIENDLHGSVEHQEMFKELSNKEEKRFEAGRGKYLFWRRWQNKPIDFSKLHGKFYGTGDETPVKEMICSEFATKTTVVSLVELNHQLEQKIKEHRNEPKSTAYSDMLDLPISDHIRLEYYYPGKLVGELMRRGCITQVEKPKILQQIMTV